MERQTYQLYRLSCLTFLCSGKEVGARRHHRLQRSQLCQEHLNMLDYDLRGVTTGWEDSLDRGLAEAMLPIPNAIGAVAVLIS